MKLSINALLLFLSLILAVSFVAEGKPPEMVYLENRHIRVGINLKWGGAITHVSKAGGPNLINSYDLGRQIQQSYYSGPPNYQNAVKKKNPNWKTFPWNPIQTGDSYNFGSRVIEHKIQGDKLYVKTVPMLWPMQNDPAECTMETWIYLSPSSPVFSYKARLTNSRSDKTIYAAMPQEVPAIYTNGPWHKLITYNGANPFSDGAVTEIRNDHKEPWPWVNILATEGWAALVNEDGTGIGISVPNASEFHGGFNGHRGHGGEKSTNTGYMSPITHEILDHNIVYEYTRRFILGSIQDIRKEAKRLKNKALPAWDFNQARHGWHFENGSDEGWPLSEKGLVLKAKNSQTPIRLLSPITFWRAESAQTLAIELTSESSGIMTVYWRGMPNEAASTKPSLWHAWKKTWWTNKRSTTKRITKIKKRWIKVQLKGLPHYEGGLTGLAIHLPFDAVVHQIRLEAF
jgi:hypothetical protein|tara:strand:- start:10622 stop:11995 length:1374 start_codon:yes stop_codon:yes gene_type:complete